jgi:hypothetical protein
VAATSDDNAAAENVTVGGRRNGNSRRAIGGRAVAKLARTVVTQQCTINRIGLPLP